VHGNHVATLAGLFTSSERPEQALGVHEHEARKGKSDEVGDKAQRYYC